MNCLRVLSLLLCFSFLTSCDFKKERNASPKPPPAPVTKATVLQPKKEENAKEVKKVEEPSVIEWEGGEFSIGESFKEADIILMLIYVDWCPHCKEFTPLLEGVTKREDKKIRLLRINADAFPDIAQQYKVEAVPKVLIFRQGEQVGEFVGSISEDKLEIIIKNITAEDSPE